MSPLGGTSSQGALMQGYGYPNSLAHSSDQIWPNRIAECQSMFMHR